MGKMIVLILVIRHIIGTAYYLLAIWEMKYGVEETWIHASGIDEKEYNIKYLESFYWALSTVLVNGSKGDTPAETVFTLIILFMAIC